jgi:hypothetical protein
MDYETAMRTLKICIPRRICLDNHIVLLALMFIISVASIGITQKTFASSQSQSDPYLLDAAEISGKKDFQITVPTNGLIQLTFIKTNPTNESSIFLYLSPFYGDKSGTELAVKLSATNLVFGAAQSIESSLLNADPVLMPENYVGTLVMSGGDIAPILWRITLSKANGLQDHPASLTVIPSKINCAVERVPFDLWGTPDIVNAVTLHNTNKTWSLEGIAIIPGEVIGGVDSDFSITKNVQFFLNGTNMPSITQLPPINHEDAERRIILPGGQVALGIGFKGLKPGDHTFEVVFTTMNSQDDSNQQKLTVDVKVADSIWPAAGVLIAAMLLSFFTYKWLGLYRNRIELQQRAAALRAQLPQRSAIYSVVWVRMLLRQAEYLAGRLLLTDPSFVTACLDQAEPVLGALNAAQKVGITICTLQPLVRNRFSFVVDRILGQMRNEGMTKEAADKAKGELDQLFTIIKENNYHDFYWKEVTDAVSTFGASFKPSDLPPVAQSIGSRAKSTLLPLGNPPQQPVQLDQMMGYEDTFARLSLLYERRKYPELCTKLVAAFAGGLDDFFKLADDDAWDRIKQAEKGEKLVVSTPSAENKIVGQAYEPIEFSITTGDEALDKAYLFTHLLRYEWSFKLRRRFRLWNSNTLEPKTVSPSVAQFAASAGMWTVSVKLLRTTQSGTEPVQVPKDIEVRVGKSSEVKFLGNLERAERWALVMAGSFALVSGLLTFYYKNPVFGSMQDYLTLFLWGVGVDQTKNFIQSIQSSSQDSKSGAGVIAGQGQRPS